MQFLCFKFYNENNQLPEATICDGKTTKKVCYTYDEDGNRIYQVNYNPNKDEDFSNYYCSYQNCDYNGTGIQLQAGGEVSQAEKDLMALIGASGAVRNSCYELIEYLNDVNREYAEVLVEQNINSRIDTVYTYGNERISREMFRQTSRTSYYPGEKFTL